MIKCNKCGKELLMEQIPEVHISEVEMPCGDINCDGKATYRNNSFGSPGPLMEVHGDQGASMSGGTPSDG